MDTQKALLVTDAPGGLTDLNGHLQRGWRVVTTAPMGGGGQAEGFAALVVIERAGQGAEAVLEGIAEEIEEALDGGDGAPFDVGIDDAIERLQREDDVIDE